jgi:hypothetical protein
MTAIGSGCSPQARRRFPCQIVPASIYGKQVAAELFRIA